MSKRVHIEIVTPERKVFSGDAEYVVAPGKKGDFGIMPGHISFLSSLKIGVLELDYSKTEKELYSVSGGYLQVSDDRVWILAETAEKSEEIDKERAKEAMKRAKERIEKKSQDDIDIDRAKLALARSLNRLKVAEWA